MQVNRLLQCKRHPPCDFLSYFCVDACMSAEIPFQKEMPDNLPKTTETTIWRKNKTETTIENIFGRENK